MFHRNIIFRPTLVAVSVTKHGAQCACCLQNKGPMLDARDNAMGPEGHRESMIKRSIWLRVLGMMIDNQHQVIHISTSPNIPSGITNLPAGSFAVFSRVIIWRGIPQWRYNRLSATRGAQSLRNMNIIFGKMTPAFPSFYVRWDTKRAGSLPSTREGNPGIRLQLPACGIHWLKSRRCDLTAGNSAKLCPLLGDLRTQVLALFSWATSDHLAQQSP